MNKKTSGTKKQIPLIPVFVMLGVSLCAFSGTAIYFLLSEHIPEWLFFIFFLGLGMHIICTSYLAFNNHNNNSKTVTGNGDLEKAIQDLKEANNIIKTMGEQNKYFGNLKLAMLNMMEDLEDEKKKLGVAKAKDDAILASMGEGIITMDSAGKIVLINRAAEDMLSYKLEELEGKLFTDVVKVINEKKEPVPFNKTPINMALLTSRKIREDTFSYFTKDGRDISVGIVVAPLILDNKTIGAIEVFRDITHEKQVDRMKTEFISLASHQLRTPLSAMKWFLEMLLNGDAGKLAAEPQEMIQNINLSNERMISLVNSLLNISRIESGRIIIDPTPTDLGALVKDVVSELKMKIEENKHNVIVSINPHIPQINIDPKLVRHVYMNLLTNAIKYTPKGGEIVIMISRKDNEIISQVSDNGYGIPANEQYKIFQKFFRAENVVKFVTDGTGLGLYLAKSIVESSGGKIWFESVKDKGTTFWFSLPEKGSAPKKGEVSLDTSRTMA